jgi:hypothetical protein
VRKPRPTRQKTNIAGSISAAWHDSQASAEPYLSNTQETDKITVVGIRLQTLPKVRNEENTGEDWKTQRTKDSFKRRETETNVTGSIPAAWQEPQSSAEHNLETTEANGARSRCNTQGTKKSH